MLRNIRVRPLHFTLFLCFSALSLFGLAGCQPTPPSTITVRIPLLGGSENEYEYEWKSIELSSLKDPYSLQSAVAKFIVQGQVNAMGQIEGRAPRLQLFLNSKGEYVAKDSVSLQLLTLYAHMEALHRMDKSHGLDQLLSWPRRVAVQFRFIEDGAMLTNNAMYSGDIDSMIFVPYTDEGGGIPIPVNGGVVAHEHFHALFFHHFSKPLRADGKYPSGSYHEVLLRGLNEGLADVWGWLYTRDPFFVGRSISSSGPSRRVDIPVKTLTTPQQIRSLSRAMDSSNRLSLAYALGNQYARSIIQIAEANQIADTDLVKAIFESIKSLRLKALNLTSRQQLNHEDFYESLILSLRSKYPSACASIKGLYMAPAQVEEQCKN